MAKQHTASTAMDRANHISRRLDRLERKHGIDPNAELTDYELEVQASLMRGGRTLEQANQIVLSQRTQLRKDAIRYGLTDRPAAPTDPLTAPTESNASLENKIQMYMKLYEYSRDEAIAHIVKTLDEHERGVYQSQLHMGKTPSQAIAFVVVSGRGLIAAERAKNARSLGRVL